MNEEFFIIEKEKLDNIKSLIDEYGLEVKSVHNLAKNNRNGDKHIIGDKSVDEVMSKIISDVNDYLDEQGITETLSNIGVTIEVGYMLDNSRWNWYNIREVI